ADEVTWNLLYEEHKRSIDQNSAPQMMPLFPRLPIGYEVDEGEESFTVMAIQYMLNEITAHYDNIEFTEQSGVYNQSTAIAIREFQMRNLLPVTGKVNKTTWDYLVDAYTITFEEYKQ
ncbi:MAG: peptidoglycan-binding protein, partial [Clostridia bacterium]|nr:peptidoglycan-binding protein [Clostridia bacterium]